MILEIDLKKDNFEGLRLFEGLQRGGLIGGPTFSAGRARLRPWPWEEDGGRLCGLGGKWGGASCQRFHI